MTLRDDELEDLAVAALEIARRAVIRSYGVVEALKDSSLEAGVAAGVLPELIERRKEFLRSGL